MNLSQIIRKARFEVDAIRASGATSALWSDEEVIDDANTAMDRAARLLRLADSAVLTKSMKSTDAAVNLISETYNPASLAIVASTFDYTLPSDFVRVENIIPLTTDFDGVRFVPATLHQRGWVDQSVLTAADISPAQGSEQIFYYTIIGARTLRIRPLPPSAFDIELLYQYRPPRLQNYSTGTIQLTLNSTTVHGVGVTWQSAGIRTPADLITTSPNLVNINTVYPRLSSLTNETDMVLARAWPSENYTGTYHISMIPLLPDEHHSWLAQVTAAIMLRKVSPDLSEAALKDLDKQLTAEVQPEIVIRQMQDSIPVDEYKAG